LCIPTFSKAKVKLCATSRVQVQLLATTLHSGKKLLEERINKMLVEKPAQCIILICQDKPRQ